MTTAEGKGEGMTQPSERETMPTKETLEHWKNDLEFLKASDLSMSNLTVRALADRLTDCLKALASARAEERERCARIAEEMQGIPCGLPPLPKCGQLIAEKIRKNNV